MSSNITPETRIFLQFLSQAKKDQVKSLFCYASVKQLNAVFEIILNYLAGNIQQDKHFDKRSNLFKTLATKKVALSRKRLILCSSPVYRSVIHKLVKIWQNM
jgi:hypothetical protein